MHGRILVIDAIVPELDQASGFVSTFSYLQILARAGFEVIFAPHDLFGGGSRQMVIALFKTGSLWQPALAKFWRS